MKKNTILISIIVIILIVLVVLYLRRPQISITPNWDKQTFKYKLSVNGCSFEGERSMIDNRPVLDRIVDEKKCDKYSFEVYKDVASIWEEGKSKSIKTIIIDIPSKSIYESSAIRG